MCHIVTKQINQERCVRMADEEIIPDELDSMDPHDLYESINKLAEEKGFLENIFNTISEGVMVIDNNLKIKYRNPAATRLLGIPDDTSRLSVASFLKGVDWEALIADKGRSERRELEVLYPERRIIRFYLVPHEKADFVTVILTDITEDYEKNASKVESERSKIISMLAAGVAHEIGNPLNSLYLNLQLLQRMFRKENVDLAEAAESIDASKKEVERLDAILNQFLKALRPAKLHFRPTDLRTVLGEALNFMRHEIENRNVDVKCHWADTLPQIPADEGQLKQAFFNIIKNALQSMPQGGTVSIFCELNEEQEVEVRIIDTGKGISPENMTKLFNAFYTTKAAGNGLGLMIVERIFRQHGARLSVESVEGKGTCFTIVFPGSGSRVRVLPPANQYAGILPAAKEGEAE